MARQFNLIPRGAARVETRFRRIVTPLPPPAAILLLETLRNIEPVAMQGQPPVIWDRAEGFQVWDRFVRVPFPDGWRTKETSFESFERALRERGAEPSNAAGVVMETSQGGSAAFAPLAGAG